MSTSGQAKRVQHGERIARVYEVGISDDAVHHRPPPGGGWIDVQSFESSDGRMALIDVNDELERVIVPLSLKGVAQLRSALDRYERSAREALTSGARVVQ